jgi:isopenicillin N synthase-like dioxygenase
MIGSNLEAIVVISQHELNQNDQALDAKLRQAAHQGFFYLELPSKAQQLLNNSIQFAHTFCQNEILKTTKLPGFSGYHDREHAQVESYYLERSLWNQFFPAAVAELGEILTHESTRLFHKILPLVIPHLSKNAWNVATGGVSDGNGLCHFSFNHYRIGIDAIGLKPHRDFGYLSLLFINKEGLYAKIDGTWISIAPKPGYLIVNFGKAFEILVNDSSKLTACWHYVEKISEAKHGGNRISFVLSTDNDLAMPLQKVMPNGELEVVYAQYTEFLDSSFNDLYVEADIS